jgi:transcriptional regulator with XRE-family HTH domain
MKAENWIDRVKAVKGWETDYRVAKELGLSRSAVSGYRSKTPTLDEETALKVAHALDVNAAIVLADQAIERARTQEARKAWNAVLQAIWGKEKAPALEGLGIGGNGGIRTLDGALHPILP